MKNKFLIIIFFSCIWSCSEEVDIKKIEEPVVIGLKDLAVKKGKFIGNLMRDDFFNNFQINDGHIDNILKSEYNALVVGNKMKMSNLLKNKPSDPFNITISDINTYNIDRFIDYANKNGMKKRGHVMIWFKQIPKWLEEESVEWTAQEIYDFSKSYIIALTNYTSGKIEEWDVLNEAIVNNGFREGTWYEKVNIEENNNGEKGYLKYFSNI